MSQKINNKKRLLFLITQAEMGGAQQFLLQLISGLEPERYNIMVATGSDSGVGLLDKLPAHVTTGVVRHLKRSPNPISDIRSLFEIRQLLSEYKPDIFFLNSSKAGFNGSLATVFPRRLKPMPKVIYRIGGWTFNDPWSWPKKFVYFCLEYFSAAWKDIIIVNNAHDLKQARSLGIKPRQKAILIHNGIDIERLPFTDKDIARNRLAPTVRTDHRLWLGTIANFYPTKGLEYLIRAMTDLRDRCNLIIIGDGPERARLQELVSELGLDDSVQLVGTIPQAALYLKAFDIYVQPSLKEGFSWALLEAMAAGLPVVTTPAGAAPEIITRSENGLLIKPRSPKAIVDTIRELIDDQHMLRALGQKAHATVTNGYTLQRMLNEYKKLID